MVMIRTKTLPIALWIVGAVIIASGVFMNWMEISVTFIDGTEQTIAASGLDLYIKYGGIGMPVDGSAPIIYLLIAVSVTLLAIAHWKRGENSPVTLGLTMLIFVSIMAISGFTAVDSMTMYAEPPPGVNVYGIPEWLNGIVSGEISHATMNGSYGYMVSIVGQLVSFASAILYINRNQSS